MSAHPVFQKVATVFGKPIAAPSANRFGRISPTTAEHVLAELNGRIPLIVDGGPCIHGIESTIVLVDGEELEILRHGPIDADQLSQFGKLPHRRRKRRRTRHDEEPLRSSHEIDNIGRRGIRTPGSLFERTCRFPIVVHSRRRIRKSGAPHQKTKSPRSRRESLRRDAPPRRIRCGTHRCGTGARGGIGHCDHGSFEEGCRA